MDHDLDQALEAIQERQCALSDAALALVPSFDLDTSVTMAGTYADVAGRRALARITTECADLDALAFTLLTHNTIRF